MEVVVTWQGDQRFRAVTRAGAELVVDGESAGGPSPMETLQIALATCMGIDIVDILGKGRQDVTACVLRVSGSRSEKPPHRFTALHLKLELSGRNINGNKVDRAIKLSRDTYCSVWNSMAPDIDLSFEVELLEAASA